MSDRHSLSSDNFYVGSDNVRCPTVILSTARASEHNNIKRFGTRTEHFKQSFFPFCVIKWCKLDISLRKPGNIKRFQSIAAFTLIYILIVNILSANKTIYKWPHLYIET